MTAQTFGARLRMLRQQARMTQQSVADALHIDRSTYTKYETRGVTPDQQGLLRLARLFGVTVDYLLGREEDDKPCPCLTNDEEEALRLTLQEKMLVQKFRQMSLQEQETVMQQVEKATRERKKRL